MKKKEKKKESFSFFLGRERVFFFFSWPLSFFLDRSLGRQRVFFNFFFLVFLSLSWSSSCFLFFLLSCFLL